MTTQKCINTSETENNRFAYINVYTILSSQTVKKINLPYFHLLFIVFHFISFPFSLYSMGKRNKIVGIAAFLALNVASAYKDQNYGSGAITRCEYPGTGGYFISKDKYPYSGAVDACKALGGSLADLGGENFLHASDIVLSCTGPNQRAWIGYVFFFLYLKSKALLICSFKFMGL